MKSEIKKLKNLGANVQEVKGGLKLIGDWDNSYNEFHNLFTEITGKLYTSNSIQHPGFLKNLSTLGELYTTHSVQDPDFLKNLSTLGELYTYNSVQNPDFLKNLTSLGVLDTSNSVQHHDFLKNLSRLGYLSTRYSVQHPDFLKNVKITLDLTKNKYENRNFSNFLRKILKI